MEAESKESPAVADIARDVWALVHPDGGALAHLGFTTSAPSLPSIFRVDAAAAASIGVTALAAAEVWRERTGRQQTVSVDSADAALAYRSERYLQLNGQPVEHPRPAQSYFKDRDGRWMQLHMVYPHHRAGILAALGVADVSGENERDAVTAAVAARDAVELETELAALGLPAYAERSHEEWSAAGQAAALAALPLIELERIGDAPPLRLAPDASRILDGIRVMDLTRVIAGPVCGRTLAAHGADVMRIHPPHLTEVAGLLMDGGRGKRCTNLNLRETADRLAFERLLADAQVFVQGFRPGGLEELGYGPAALAERVPGLVYVSLSAWSHTGPWAGRHGFDSLVQTASGITRAGAVAASSDSPRPLPCQVLDHSTGYLAAFGAMCALARQMREGGSWLVRLSLAQTGHWFDRLGRVDGLDIPEPDEARIASRLRPMASPFGELRASLPVARFSETEPGWARPPVPLGHDVPFW
ncbi:MAG: CoA transferase [Pseudomonadota bacterium]